ncbi:hypothetical protein COP2_037962 [Malus domestica]
MADFGDEDASPKPSPHAQTRIPAPPSAISFRSIFHHNGQMGRSKNNLLESDDVQVPQRPMIYYLSANIFINFIATYLTATSSLVCLSASAFSLIDGLVPVGFFGP